MRLHPLKPLLYLEWLFLALALLYPWLGPIDPLAIITLRDGRNPSVAVGFAVSHPIGWLIPIAWVMLWGFCWRLPRVNRQFIVFILLSPFLLVLISLFLAPIFGVYQEYCLWGLLGLTLGYFIYLGTRIEAQTTWLNKWLYTGVAFFLIWYIFFLISELHTGVKSNLESLLLLHLVALIRACLMFLGKQRWVAIILLMASYQSVTIVIGSIWGDLINLVDRDVTLRSVDVQRVLEISIYNVTIVFTAITALLVLLVNTLVSEHRSREQLVQAHSQLRHYAQRIEDQTMLTERNHIAREIHDALGHTLTAQSIQLENALVLFEPEPDRAYEFLTQAKALSQTALQEVRRSVAQLRTNLLAGKSFEAAIDDLITEFQQAYPCIVDCQIEVFRMPIEAQSACYRIIQEALTNIARHSKADRVSINLNVINSSIFQLQISDNGCGFQQDQTTSGFGLQGIQERAAAIGAQCTIESTPGQGCRLQLSEIAVKPRGCQ